MVETTSDSKGETTPLLSGSDSTSNEELVASSRAVISDVVVNATTVVFAAVVVFVTSVTSVACRNNGDVEKLQDELQVSTRVHALRVLFLIITSFFCLTNIFGFPKQIVEDQWEHTAFGARFIPGQGLSNGQKRVAAGLIELAGILLALVPFGPPMFQCLGYGILATSFGRGALLNSTFDWRKACAAGAVAALGFWLLFNVICPAGADPKPE